MIVFIICVGASCGFSPLHKDLGSMKIFENIEIQKEKSSIAFLIEEALEQKADFAKSGQIALQFGPTIKNSYGVITKENEITRYSVTLDVDYVYTIKKK